MTKIPMSNKYHSYSIEDFDKFDCLKLSKRFYLVLAFVLRGYVIWLMSVTNMKDRVVTMQWIYPEINLFFLSLLSGSLGLFVILIISLRRPDSAVWVKKIWPHCRSLLVVALSFDFIINLIAYLCWQMTSLLWIICQGVIACSLIAMCFTSGRIQINLLEFPKSLPNN
jgi:hypothetical protein|tara:strand:- start:922 stop:1425 length:504 start_codon:yes stop_codon:yes gene_type:complete